jgi:DNA-directed RNA polymerase specialized sigma24 family protein
MRARASSTRIGWSGIPNDEGVSGLSHSSVHAVRSCRAGLPVRDRERTVSDDVAARNFRFTVGCVSASSVVSHTDPHHTPLPAGAVELWSLLDGLPPRQRTAVVLRHVSDLTESDIAAAMGVTRSTVSNTLHDAYRNLRDMLEASVEEKPDACTR